jgi:hypothetical protein
MDNLSTTSIDISNQIGALELGDNLESHGDGVLEAAGASIGHTEILQACPTRLCVGDGVLEAAASASSMPSNDVTCGKPPTIYRCIGDGALESAGANVNLAPHTQMHPVCTN